MRLTLSFKGKVLRVFALEEGETVVGRDPSCGVHIDSLAVHPRHLSVYVQGARASLRTHPDAPPVTIDGQPVTERDLADGDSLQIGKHTLTLSADSTVAAALQAVTSRAPSSATGWLQVMSGAHVGRTFPLDRHMTRIGNAGGHSAEITLREDGYFISRLEGAEVATLDGQPIGDEGARLRDGGVVHVGGLELQFFLGPSGERSHAVADAGGDAARRHFSRIAFDGEARLLGAQSEWTGKLIDVSMKGALMQRPANLNAAPGDRFTLELVHELDRYLIRMEVTVARVTERTVGFHCEHIDLDSISHLRRMVELNLGDPELLERELGELAEPGA